MVFSLALRGHGDGEHGLEHAVLDADEVVVQLDVDRWRLALEEYLRRVRDLHREVLHVDLLDREDGWLFWGRSWNFLRG
jgi:hypothetical protein